MFFISLLKYIKGYLLVHLTGYAPERFLNMCGKRNILVWNLRKTEDGYYRTLENEEVLAMDEYKDLPVLDAEKEGIKCL